MKIPGQVPQTMRMTPEGQTQILRTVNDRTNSLRPPVRVDRAPVGIRTPRPHPSLQTSRLSAWHRQVRIVCLRLRFDPSSESSGRGRSASLEVGDPIMQRGEEDLEIDPGHIVTGRSVGEILRVDSAAPEVRT